MLSLKHHKNVWNIFTSHWNAQNNEKRHFIWLLIYSTLVKQGILSSFQTQKLEFQERSLITMIVNTLYKIAVLHEAPVTTLLLNIVNDILGYFQNRIFLLCASINQSMASSLLSGWWGEMGSRVPSAQDSSVELLFTSCNFQSCLICWLLVFFCLFPFNLLLYLS